MLSVGLSLVLAAASVAAPPDSADVRAVLDHLGRDVITPTYADLDRAAADLADATAALAEAPSDRALDDARARWRTTRRVWEQAEAFLFGPVTFAGLDASLDTWPVNVVDLEGLLASDLPLDRDLLGRLDATMKGFHALEYLLWGPDGDRAAAALTSRERSYLRLIADALAADVRALHQAWVGDDGYAAGLRSAGDPERSVYATRRDALYELLMGVLFITDEVASEKLLVPLLAGNGEFAESQFSESSREDVVDNLQSVVHVYAGAYGGRSGPGLSDLVVARDPALDARFRAELEAAQAAVRAIPGSLEAAIVEAPETIEAARDAVQAVQRTLEDEMIYLLVPPEDG